MRRIFVEPALKARARRKRPFALNCATDVFECQRRQRAIRRRQIAAGEIVQYRVKLLVQFRFGQVFEFLRRDDVSHVSLLVLLPATIADFMTRTEQRVRMTALGETLVEKSQRSDSDDRFAVTKDEPMPGCE